MQHHWPSTIIADRLSTDSNPIIGDPPSEITKVFTFPWVYRGKASLQQSLGATGLLNARSGQRSPRAMLAISLFSVSQLRGNEMPQWIRIVRSQKIELKLPSRTFGFELKSLISGLLVSSNPSWKHWTTSPDDGNADGNVSIKPPSYD